MEGGSDGSPGAGTPYTRLGIGGYYLDPSRPDGLLKILQCPSWMAEVPYFNYTYPTTGSGGTDAVPTAADPAVAAAGGLAAAAFPPPQKAAENVVPFMNRFARAVYVAEAVRDRAVDLMGRLRFDICPGSSVKVQGVPERFTAGDALAEDFHATVRQVTYLFDAEASSVATAFHLADLRTASENDASSPLSLERHPMWKDAWSGASLSEEFGC